MRARSMRTREDMCRQWGDPARRHAACLCDARRAPRAARVPPPTPFSSSSPLERAERRVLAEGQQPRPQVLVQREVNACGAWRVGAKEGKGEMKGERGRRKERGREFSCGAAPTEELEAAPPARAGAPS